MWKLKVVKKGDEELFATSGGCEDTDEYYETGWFDTEAEATKRIEVVMNALGVSFMWE